MPLLCGVQLLKQLSFFRFWVCREFVYYSRSSRLETSLKKKKKKIKRQKKAVLSEGRHVLCFDFPCLLAYFREATNILPCSQGQPLYFLPWCPKYLLPGNDKACPTSERLCLHPFWLCVPTTLHNSPHLTETRSAFPSPANQNGS